MAQVEIIQKALIWGQTLSNRNDLLLGIWVKTYVEK